MEEPEPVEKPEPEPPAVEPCPICGLTPKLKHACVTRNYRGYYLEKDSWQFLEWCDHVESILSFASFFEDESVQKWNTGCQRLKTVIDEPIPECPACGEKPVVQTDSESDIPQLVCSCNELLSNVEITNVYKRKREWIRRCMELKRKQDNVKDMEQLIGETQ
ncbi:hypothetical protein [Bifidobacterium longum]|uniref:hypothetical protein n=1 Tax=Bifidobacterium longum TaxID=216816 RepID=UPI00103A3C34|nr:hypothetical protein [Bifidobacterium longum]